MQPSASAEQKWTQEQILNRILDRHPLAPAKSSRGLELADIDPDAILWILSEDVPTDKEPVVPRLAEALLRRRADLRRAFPDPLGASRQALGYWFSTWGRAEYGLEWALVRPVIRGLPFGMRLRARLWWLRRRLRLLTDNRKVRPQQNRYDPPNQAGMHVFGWIDAPSGIAQACRGTLAALEEGALDYVVTNLDDLPSLPSYRWAQRVQDEQSLALQLHHVNADMMDFVFRRIPYDMDQSVYRIGYWFWELSQFPADLYWTYNFVDEVWTPSRFCCDALSEYAPVDVHLVPPCVPAPVPQPGARTDLNIPLDSFLILSSFDARSIAQRKNPVGLVEAFAQVASRTDRTVHLLFNVVNPDVAPDLVDFLREQTYQLPITLLTGGVSRLQYTAMLTACDAYVSLHRSEGLGLPLIEAMYLEKPVIATEYGGCTDFLNDTTGWPVDYRITRIDKALGPYPAGAKWAEPDLADAIEKLGRVIARPDEVKAKVGPARQTVTETYSISASAERFRAQLDRLDSIELTKSTTHSM